MAESASILDEDIKESMSPDLFSECDEQETGPQNLSESHLTEDIEPELMDESLEYKGSSMDEIYKGLDIYHYQQPPIRPSEHHTVLFELPIPNRGPPKPFPFQPVDKWSEYYVRMPHSPQCPYTTQNNCDDPERRIRWEVIQESLLQNFISSLQLEAAILSYNNKYASQWNFNALHTMLGEFDEDITNIFFEQSLPKVIQLALQLPALITGPIPLLKQHSNNSISLSQLQVASLLANALLCTFPRRNAVNSRSEYASYPYINFNGLFAAHDKNYHRLRVVIEKLKCIFHYFRRVTTSHPEGTITIQRRYISKENCPKWDRVKCPLPPLHITSKGTIEDQGAGLLQVDFANKYVGGGVLNRGCVQEEIRFVICPELLVTMLVTEVLDDTEALIITGAERYSNYDGYSDTFEWSGDHIDQTPRDSSGRRKTSIVAIDALYFNQAYRQYHGRCIIRELNKAYVGFSSCEMSSSDLSGIATGNWGCGAFRGDPHLKSLIQLMAAAVNQRSVVYFTFGDKTLRDDIANMYWYLVSHEVNVGRLFSLLRAYESESRRYQTLYDFLYKRAKIKPLMKFFNALSPTSTNPQVISIKASPKKNDTKLKSMITKKSDSKNTPRELKREEDIRDLLEKDYDEDIEEENSQCSDDLFEDCSNKVENSEEKWDKYMKNRSENKNLENTSADTKKIDDDKRSVWSHFSNKETQEDKFRIGPTRKRRTGLEEFNKQSIISDENGHELITDDSSIPDSDEEFPKSIEESKNVTTIQEMDRIPKPVVDKQDPSIESTSNINNLNNHKSNKTSPSPRKPEHRKHIQTKIVDFFPRKN